MSFLIGLVIGAIGGGTAVFVYYRKIMAKLKGAMASMDRAAAD